MTNRGMFSDEVGLPAALAPLLVHETWPIVCEFATLKGDGTPITVPVGAFPGEAGRAIGISVRLGFPLKAERARRNPKVSLLYSEPNGSPLEKPPIILVQGEATVRDADLQANLDRMVREQRARLRMFRMMPQFMLRWMRGYLASVWVDVTPLKISWWPDRDQSQPAQVWEAAPGTAAPPSDPPPGPRPAKRPPFTEPAKDPRGAVADAVARLGAPVLTVVDEAGYPLPVRTLGSTVEAAGVRLQLPAGWSPAATGRACLTFHTIDVKNGEMTGNENVLFLGSVITDEAGALFQVERQLPSMSAKLDGPKDVLAFISSVRVTSRNARVEAARRGGPMPTI